MSVFTTAMFLETMQNLQRGVHLNSMAHGFWDGQENCNIPTKIALIHSELSEALEAHRGQLPSGYSLHETQWWTEDGGVYPSPSEDLPVGMVKPEGMAIELADAVIRIMDLAEHLGVDLARATLDKSRYNETRPKMHGGKKY